MVTGGPGPRWLHVCRSGCPGGLAGAYAGAVHRYLCGALRDADAANNLFQESPCAFLRGDFRAADPGRGRFRDFVKTALFHLIVDYQRRQHRKPMPLAGVPEPAEEPPSIAAADREFLDGWRQTLIDHTWEALRQLEERTGRPLHTVLRFRADHPDLSSSDLAQALGTRLGKAYSPEAIRQILHRARRNSPICSWRRSAARWKTLHPSGCGKS